MRFLPLLGKMLKDDEVIEILEALDMDVTPKIPSSSVQLFWFQFWFDGKPQTGKSPLARMLDFI